LAPAASPPPAPGLFSEAMRQACVGLVLIFFVIVAATPLAEKLVNSSEANSTGGRPSFEHWTELKESEAEKLEEAKANQAKKAAVGKVLTLLRDLKANVMAEGLAEAKTYDKFACFCKDTTADKSEAITKGLSRKEALSASIGESNARREELGLSISTLLGTIDQVERDLALAREADRGRLEEYGRNAADLSGALGALREAIRALKASKQAPSSLSQLRSVAQTVRTAALMADALGLVGRGTSAAQTDALFLQKIDAPDVPMEDYTFRSAGIIGTLEKLLDDFRAKKDEVDSAEVTAAAAHHAFVQERTDVLKAKNVEVDNARKDRALQLKDIASASQELTTVSATLLDDQQYLKELSAMCTGKAQTWDKRNKVRTDELSALQSAIAIIGSTVDQKTTSDTLRLAQQGTSVLLADSVARNANAMNAIEAEVEGVEGQDSTALAFLQFGQAEPKKALLARVMKVEKHRTASALPDGGGAPVGASAAGASAEDAAAGGAATVAGREAVVALLRGRGLQLRSALLTSLASQVAADPFGKVKQLIQELLERLLHEAGDEANQKAWCDKASSDAAQKRDHAARDIEELNSHSMQLEAQIGQLEKDLVKLGLEVMDIGWSREFFTNERAEEKADNNRTVSEAQEGLHAVEEAVRILSQFYGAAAKAAAVAATGQQQLLLHQPPQQRQQQQQQPPLQQRPRLQPKQQQQPQQQQQQTPQQPQQQHHQPQQQVAQVKLLAAFVSQTRPNEDVPEAGFDIDEAYLGAQGAATGILGMLEVIKSDFRRTVQEVLAEEASEQAEFLEVMTSIEKSEAEKQVAIDTMNGYKSDSTAMYLTAQDSLKDKVEVVRTALEELIKLKQVCVDTGMSYSERKARRQDELEALQKALCILDSHTKYGTDGAGDNC